MNEIRINRVLISVTDKTGIVDFARELKNLGCELISTGGTRNLLLNNEIDSTDIADFTGNPEAFGGRMKTISFQVESALLYDRIKDKAEADKYRILPIDMVVCNLYDFAKFKDDKPDLSLLIENIDIGGPTMIRAGAKNYRFVAVVTDPSDYQWIIQELEQLQGSISEESRFRLMRKAFNLTADYDALIAQTMDELAGIKGLRFKFEKGEKLRYGENSHQKGFLYREKGAINSLYDLKILHGKKISYNNLSDIQSALEVVAEFDVPTCAIVKHNNTCGLSCGSKQNNVFRYAWAGDPVSAFGSIIAFNTEIELDTAKFLRLNDDDKKKRKFVEVIIAPGFREDAFSYLCYHKNLRIIEADPKIALKTKSMKYLAGSLLWQEVDHQLYNDFEIVTEKKIDLNSEKLLLEFGLKAVRNLKSNAIALVRKTEDNYFQLIGMGAGQPNRLVATQLAIQKAKENLIREYQTTEIIYRTNSLESYLEKEFKRTVLISDAFFPFADNVELAYNAGIYIIIQPGGSIRDKKVIKKCDQLGVTMLFTGLRHFKH